MVLSLLLSLTDGVILGQVKDGSVTLEFDVSEPGDELVHDFLAESVDDAELHERLLLVDELQLDLEERVLFPEEN